MSAKKMIIIKAGSTVLKDLLSKRGDYEDWIRTAINAQPSNFAICNVYKGEDPFPSFDSISGIIITGSLSNVTQHEEWMEKTASWLSEAVALSIPVFGICFGHQLLAYALGGRVEYNKSGKEVGVVSAILTPDAQDDILFKDLPSVMNVFVHHQQSVSVLPENAVLLASTSRIQNYAFRYGKSAWGVQFHPEFDRYILQRLEKKDKDFSDNESMEHEAAYEYSVSKILLQKFYSLCMTEDD